MTKKMIKYYGSKDMIFLYNNMVFRKPSVFVNR